MSMSRYTLAWPVSVVTLTPPFFDGGVFALRVVSIYNRSKLIWCASSVLVISWLVATIYVRMYFGYIVKTGIDDELHR